MSKHTFCTFARISDAGARSSGVTDTQKTKLSDHQKISLASNVLFCVIV